jgi:hypothetical protein
MLAAMVIAVATVLLVTEDRLLTLGLQVGIAEYNAHMYCGLTVDEVRGDLLTLTATARGVSIEPTCAGLSQDRGELDQHLKSGQALVRVMRQREISWREVRIWLRQQLIVGAFIHRRVRLSVHPT